ncbi:LysR family transcriptional regulator [Burkholderia gladioli]|uniref:LysR family transcriptional regulator n=1 Tax=Burkholderia gladioli TaxID=28095 RepID=UPI001C225F01|nr:LysR family transcriptional regulator [Burkholderia gladioli]MBU9196226.1 LysR family transcriptional regulator [Burkholderia gladioli]
MLHGIALRYFVEVGRTGSLAGASDTLHVAVSAISRQISKLEQDVGAPLFERMPRGMVLTEAGELLAAHARRALLEAEAVIGEISAGREQAGGLVRLGCTEGFTRSFLPEVLARHHERVPLARYQLRSGTPAQVEHWVTIGEVDLGIAFSGGGTPAVSIEYEIDMPVRALLAPTHPLAAREALTLEDLRAWPLALLERGNTVRQLFDLCCAARGVRIEPLLSSNNSAVLHAFAARTGAVTLGSAVALKGLAQGSTLLARAIDEPLLSERRLRVMSMRERRLPAVARSLLAELIAQLGQA